MNTPSPLIPQGTSPDRGKSSVYTKILLVIGLHVIVFGGILLQGCKENKTGATGGSTDQTASTVDTNPPPIAEAPPALAPNTNYPPPLSPAPANSYAAAPPTTPGANPMATPGQPPSPTLTAPPMTPIAPAAPGAPAAVGGEYVVARGDTLAVIAKKNGVSLKSLLAANPGIEPRKLKIGTKLQLPESATGAAAATPGGAPVVAAETGNGETSVYTVKPGDMLGRIAKSHGTTVAKIKALNDLKTTSIKVGQKLKLPGGRTTEPATAAAETPAAPTTTYAATPPTGGATAR